MRVLVMALLVAGLSSAVAGRSTQSASSELPRGLDGPLRVPADNALTPAKIALGRRLFFDVRLSRTEKLSCATCHDPAHAFADQRTVSAGVDARAGRRHTPALINRGLGESFFWDGRAATLESQVTQPITHPDELGFTVSGALSRLRGDRAYAADFRAVFGRATNEADLARALAAYVRRILSGDSRVDRYIEGDRSALTAEEQRGLRVFRARGLCTTCHAGSNFTDEKFHNTGVAWRPDEAGGGRLADEGRFEVTGRPADRGAFRTPTLREIARTAPYMHDGSLATLEEVIDFYDRGGRANPHLDKEMMPLGLSPADKAALAAFLRALSGAVTEGR